MEEEGDAVTFSPAHALSAARLCQRAYDGPNVITRNAQALVLRDPLRVAIAGTNGLGDVRHDADFDLVRVGAKERAHEGFFKHYKELQSDVVAMAAAGHVDGPRLITGHSLGASTSVLMVWHKPYLFAGGDVYLFGCPGVGDGGFAESFALVCRTHRITVWRIVNRGDLVATFDAGRYCHVGKLAEIGKPWDRRPDHPIREYIRELEAMI